MAIYDREAAKKGVEQIWTELNQLLRDVEAADASKYDELLKKYSSYPITHQIAWDLTEHTPEQAQELADKVRSALLALSTKAGVASADIPRLFNA